ncbi:MAG TPA: 2OG-Fe(II) oxygenase [Myxococcaceae bacterium]|nr:2OG-Fe(II) oxygenase [Myxococcaceae bacterium]
MPERPSGFFIPAFSEGYFGPPDTPRLRDLLAPAAAWSPLASEAAVELVAKAFADVDPAFPRHVCLRGMLHASLADAIHGDLERAPFRRHHHGPYPLHVAPLDHLQPGALASFCAWLQSPEAADFHAAVVGWAQPLRTRQVQVSRMQVGEFFPPHVDTQASGLAVIYNFSRDWDPSHGGALAFPHPASPGMDGIVVPALFNSCFIFHTTGAIHRVTPIQPESGGRSRYSVTAFMLGA